MLSKEWADPKSECYQESPPLAVSELLVQALHRMQTQIIWKKLRLGGMSCFKICRTNFKAEKFLPREYFVGFSNLLDAKVASNLGHKLGRLQERNASSSDEAGES